MENLFGNHIKQLRIEHGLTQLDVVDFLKEVGINVTSVYISKIENGKVTVPPSESVVIGLARVFEQDVELMLDLSGQFSPKKLREAVKDNNQVNALLRRLQEGRIPKGTMDKIMTLVWGTCNPI